MILQAETQQRLDGRKGCRKIEPRRSGWHNAEISAAHQEVATRAVDPRRIEDREGEAATIERGEDLRQLRQALAVDAIDRDIVCRAGIAPACQ